MRKNATAPRRLYTISSNLVVLHSGKRFGVLAEKSEVNPEGLVTVEVNKTGSKATVTQKRRGKESVVETWSAIEA
jgi:hypothetical protein